MNRIVGEYILADFKRCLTAANDFVTGKGFDWKYIDSFNLLSKVIIATPKNPLNSYLLYIKSPILITEIVKEYRCPNNFFKKGRFRGKEYKFIKPNFEILDILDKLYFK
ncbi:hypothetical protein AB1K81_05205 [Ornithinibacillus sp. 179-J 7C1 HS]